VHHWGLERSFSVDSILLSAIWSSFFVYIINLAFCCILFSFSIETYIFCDNFSSLFYTKNHIIKLFSPELSFYTSFHSYIIIKFESEASYSVSTVCLINITKRFACLSSLSLDFR
jgi:hypothetical protein